MFFGNSRAKDEEITKLKEEYTHQNYTKKLELNNIEPNGVFDRLVVDVNLLQEEITNLLVENKLNGLTLDKSSDILLENVNLLNKNSNEAATALEETAATIEEISSNISNNTENVVKMSTFATAVTTSANNGEKLAKEQQQGIEQINDAINSIDQQTQQNASIASQTNEVATQTDTIAKLIVQNANLKEFVGKESVTVKDIESNNDVVTQTNHTNIPKKSNVSQSSIQSIKPITSNSANDEWASF